MRLNRFIASTGYCSRRAADRAIQSGKVSINGTVVTDFTQVDPEKDRVTIDGQLLSVDQKQYFLFYKPMKVVSTLSDPQNRPTILDYFNKISQRLFPVGRLDFMTEGAIIMTNDGDFANHLMHPRYQKKKIYKAIIDKELTINEMRHFQEGVVIDGKRTAPAIIEADKEPNTYLITLREGRNRQIRKMFDYFERNVIHLKRTAIGNVTLGTLKPGRYRPLTSGEFNSLMGK